MRAVPVPALAAHLCKLRAAGYTLVGLEQTTDSTPLPEYRCEIEGLKYSMHYVSRFGMSLSSNF